MSALAFVFTILVAAPVLHAPSERIFGMEIVGRHHDPFTAMEQFGRPITEIVRGLYSQPLTDVPGALLQRAAGPVAAYNWLVLLTFPLSAATAYLLARHLSISPAGAAIAASAFAFSPFHLAHAAYHPHIAQTQWIPLYFFALWRCLDDATPAAIGLLIVSTACVTLSNFYGGLIAATITPVAAGAYWLFVSKRQARRHDLATTIATLAAVAIGGIGYAWYAAHAVFANRTAVAFSRDDLFRYSAKWWSYLVPPVEHPLLGAVAKRVWNAAGVHEGLLEQQVSLGWGLIVLGIVGVFAWGKRDRQTPALRAVPVLAAVAIAALVCSLSPERVIGPLTFVRPSAFLYKVVPMFRAYARFGVVVQLMAALLAAIGAQHLWRSPIERARFACVALLVLAAAEYAVWPAAVWRDVLPTAAHRWVTRQTDHVHALDCAPLSVESASIKWLSGYRISLGGGWFDDCSEPNFAGKLSSAGYTHLIVRRATSDGRWFAGRTPDGMQLAARFDDGDVFAVTAPTPLVYTVRLTAFYPREYDKSWTWRWMGPDASWKIANTGDKPIVADVDVELTAFAAARRLAVLLDGSEVETATVPVQRGMNRIGPLALTPGLHDLVFRPMDPPIVAGDLIGSGDRRPLSFAVGTWRWTVQGARP